MSLATIDWDAVASARGGAHDGTEVVITGWLVPTETTASSGYALLAADPPCCCPPRDPARAIEVFLRSPSAVGAGRVRLRGRWRALAGDPTGWRYQLADARVAGLPWPARLTRRAALGAVALAAFAGRGRSRAAELGADDATVDMHSHAGRFTGVRRVENGGTFEPVAQPMRAGGMAVVCLAIVSDAPCHRVMPDGRIHPYRQPDPGELYRYGKLSFARLQELISLDGLAVVTDGPALRAARAGTPSAIVTAEGADFLEGRLERVDEAYERYQLRHLQLTHYRPNELGDIQTEPPVYGGLTDFGAAVIRRCNERGIVVDVAHGTYDLVKRAASVTTKPLLLSHTSLGADPKPFSRLISPDHARAIAATGGVIGVWPPANVFPSLRAMARGIARLTDLVGVAHVGLGTDMLGLVGPSVLATYAQLPDLASALLEEGFSRADAVAILGGNYVRVFEASLA